MDRRKFLRAIGFGGASLGLTGLKKSRETYREINLEELFKNRDKYIGSKVFIIGFVSCEKDGKNAELSYKGTSRDYGPSALAFNLNDRPNSKAWEKALWQQHESGQISYKNYLETVCNEPKINCWASGHSCGEAYLALQEALKKDSSIAVDVKGTVGKGHLRVEELFVLVGKAEIPFFYDKPWN